jgi:ADP-ribose pyrophosphatase
MPKPAEGSSGPVAKDSLKPWAVLKSTEIFSADPWIGLSVDKVLLPDGGIVEDYYQIKLQDYAVTFAETADQEVVAIRLYKHGAGRVSLVLPAGSLEDGEEPLTCAQRELLEETGYASDRWESLGSFVVNGNYGCGNAHLFAARDVRRVAEPDAGDLESIEVVLMRPDEILDAVRSGDVVGLGTVAAIAMALNSAIRSD